MNFPELLKKNYKARNRLYLEIIDFQKQALELSRYGQTLSFSLPENFTYEELTDFIKFVEDLGFKVNQLDPEVYDCKNLNISWSNA